MRERGYTLTRPDLARVRGAVRHVETLSREGVNVTPLPGVAMLATAETVCRAVEITDEPPSGSPDLSVMYRGVIFFRDGDAWQQASVLVRPVLDDVRLLKVGMTTLAYLVGEYTGDGEYQGHLVFSAAQTPAGCGLKYVESEEFPTYTSVAVDLDAIAGDGLEVQEGEEGECPKLKVTPTSAEPLDCGLSRAGGKLHLDLTDVATDGITWDDELCGLSWRPGCGMTVGPSPIDGEPGISVNPDALVGDSTLSALVVLPGGASCDYLGVDLEVAYTTTETVVTNVAQSVVAGKLRLTQTKVTFTNHFNAAGLLIDRTAGSPVDSYADTDNRRVQRLIALLAKVQDELHEMAAVDEQHEICEAWRRAGVPFDEDAADGDAQDDAERTLDLADHVREDAAGAAWAVTSYLSQLDGMAIDRPRRARR
jgi:hypothetical protein